MTDWTRHPDDPHVWIYKDKYTLRLEGLTWYLYEWADVPGHRPLGNALPDALDHIHTPQDYYHQPHFAVPRAWAEIVVNMHEACASEAAAE